MTQTRELTMPSVFEGTIFFKSLTKSLNLRPTWDTNRFHLHKPTRTSHIRSQPGGFLTGYQKAKLRVFHYDPSLNIHASLNIPRKLGSPGNIHHRYSHFQLILWILCNCSSISRNEHIFTQIANGSRHKGLIWGASVHVGARGTWMVFGKCWTQIENQSRNHDRG